MSAGKGRSRSQRVTKAARDRARLRRPTPEELRPLRFREWIRGARIRTLPLALAPVLIGSGAAAVYNAFNGWLAFFALVVAFALQIGVNYSNDYSDGVRGTDDVRVGPPRLTGSGRARPQAVLRAALVSFAVAGVAGLAIILLTAMWWLLLVGAAALAAAWFYTGGRRPYGYYGLGELSVFLFFGLVATVGTTWIQAGRAGTESWLGGAGIGLIACAALMVNNIRDRDQDRAAGKKTLAVIVGNRAARVLYCVFLLVPFLILWFFSWFYSIAGLTLLVLLIAVPACVITLFAKSARELILALQLTTITALLYGIGLAAAFAF